MSAYSFLDTTLFLAGPAIAANLGAGAKVAEEGITITPTGPKNSMQQGADGSVQHSLIASDSGTLTVRLLKTSPMNTVLMNAYNLQKSSGRNWGSMVGTLSNDAVGDLHTFTQVAFQTKPEISYTSEGEMLEWVFDCANIQSFLGAALNEN